MAAGGGGHLSFYYCGRESTSVGTCLFISPLIRVQIETPTSSGGATRRGRSCVSRFLSSGLCSGSAYPHFDEQEGGSGDQLSDSGSSPLQSFSRGDVERTSLHTAQLVAGHTLLLLRSDGNGRSPTTRAVLMTIVDAWWLRMFV